MGAAVDDPRSIARRVRLDIEHSQDRPRRAVAGDQRWRRELKTAKVSVRLISLAGVVFTEPRLRIWAQENRQDFRGRWPSLEVFSAPKLMLRPQPGDVNSSRGR